MLKEWKRFPFIHAQLDLTDADSEDHQIQGSSEMKLCNSPPPHTHTPLSFVNLSVCRWVFATASPAPLQEKEICGSTLVYDTPILQVFASRFA